MLSAILSENAVGSPLLNVLLAITNAACILPAVTAWYGPTPALACIPLFAGLASAVYHAMESHKHGMHGFGCAHGTSRSLLQLDRLGVAAATAMVGYQYYKRYGLTWAPTLTPVLLKFAAALGAMAISEMDHSPQSRGTYVIFHAFWHVYIFTIMDECMRTVLYI